MTRRNYLIDQRYNNKLEYISEEGNTTSITVTLKDQDGDIYLWDTCRKSKAYQTFVERKKANLTFTYKGDIYGKNIIGYVRVA